MFYVFDLDDTLAITNHRQHLLFEEYDSDADKWLTFFKACDKDEPNKPMIKLMQTLSISHRVEIWTGRSDIVREKTEAWLDANIETHLFYRPTLRMRTQGDVRSDIIIKGEWISEHGVPDIVFDDRNKMVNWWRSQGIICCQVKESDY